tara:strand:+ start:1479 stop:2093 length:615 start_codon:yes stop_codon:yes gene_type:complete
VNCQAKHLNLNKEINLPVCSVCGCIQAYRIYEVSTILPNSKVEINDLVLLLNEFEIEDKDEVIKNDKYISYTNLYYSYDSAERAVAILYYTMRDLNKPANMRKYCSFLGCKQTRVSRLAKKIARHYSNSGVFGINDIDEFLSNMQINCKAVNDACKVWNATQTLTRGIIAAYVYENTQYTQKEVCVKFGVSLPRLKRNLKKVRI